MAGNYVQYATVGSEPLAMAAGAVGPSRPSTLNFVEYAMSSVAEFAGVACMKLSASSMAEAWKWW